MSQNVRLIPSNLTAVDILTPVLFDSTPLLGGKGRTAFLNLKIAPVAGVFKLQGHNSVAARDASGAVVAPLEGDAGWFDIETVNAATAASNPMREFVLPVWLRVNVTTLQAGATDYPVVIEGIK